MQANTLQRVHPNMKRMQVARGGKRGKTSGRGGKGQTARAGNKRRPEWRDIIKRIPKLRGRGKNSNKSVKTVFQQTAVVNLGVLEANFNAGDAVTPTTLIEKGIISTVYGKVPRVKLLGDGELTKKLTITGCLVSGTAKSGIEKAGGKVELMQSQIDAEKAAVEGDRAALAKSESMSKNEAKSAAKTEKSSKPDKGAAKTERSEKKETKEKETKTKAANSSESKKK